MAKIARKYAKQFGNTAGALEMAQFGSLAAASPAYSKDPDTIQNLANWAAGWFSAVIGGNSPAIEDMNGAFLVAFYQLAYLMQTGVPEYNATTVYFVGSNVNDGYGNIFACIADAAGAGISGIPLTTAANWRRINGPNTVIVTASSSPYTLTATDNGKTFFVDTSTGAFTFNLPAAVKNFQFEVCDVGGSAYSNNITIVRAGTEKIAGTAANYVISTQWADRQFTCDGTDWWLTIGATPTTQRSIVKAGTVVAFAGASTPTGWLDCDGSALAQATYPQLYAVLAATWATCVNPNTGVAYTAPTAGQFRVPDLRSAFLRGAGGPNNAGVTTSLAGFQADTTAKNSLANSTSGVSGSVGGADGTHSHTSGAVGSTFGSSGGIAFGGGNPLPNNTSGGALMSANVNSTSSGHGHSFSLTSAAQTITGDAETRPDNVGVKYIIKAWDAS